MMWLRRFRNIAVVLIMLSTVGFLMIDGISAEGRVRSSFSYSPFRPEEGEEIVFKAKVNREGGFNFTWDFGDGSMAYGHEVKHTYRDFGYFDVVLVTSNSTGIVDVYHQSIHVEDEFSQYAALSVLLFMTMYMLFVLLMIGAIILGYTLNPLIGGILGYRAYKMAKEADEMETAKPYLLAILIAGVVSIMMVYLWFISVIVHIAAYIMLKRKLEEKGRGKIKRE